MRTFLVAVLPLSLPASLRRAARRSDPPHQNQRSAAPVKVTEVEGITEYRLANGLKVLLFPDPSKPTITVNITYLVGSRHEGYGETGMAHLLEHMLFKGSPEHKDIPSEFNKYGARFNGTTSEDRTNYYELFQASDERLEWALSLEADRMVNSFVARKDLDTEMTVVRNEYEMGENSPTGVLIKRLQSIAYDWHNYGNSTIGNRSDIENVEIANLQAFYRTYYQPDNAVLLIAGKFEPAKALQLVTKHFGAIPRPTRKLPTAVDGGADAGWRAQRHGAPRGRSAGGAGGLPRALIVAGRWLGADLRELCAGRRTLRPPAQGTGGNRQGGVHRHRHAGRRGWRPVRGAGGGQERRRSGAGARRADPHRRGFPPTIRPPPRKCSAPACRWPTPTSA